MKKMYANMHFVYGFCNRNGWAALVEYQKCCSPCRIFETVNRILRETGFFSQVTADVKNNGMQKVMFWQQCSAARMTAVAQTEFCT
jgi:hypothetical protein